MDQNEGLVFEQGIEIVLNYTIDYPVVYSS